MTSTDNLYDPVGDVIRDQIKRELPVRLTDAERLEIAEAKAMAESELDEHSATEADRRREAAKRGEEIEKRIAVMGAELRTREQRRVVLCYERWKAGQVEVVRRDLDPRDPQSVVERRAANLAEAQRAIPDAAQEDGGDVLTQAAKMQRDAGVAEDDDGDVVVPDTAAKKRRGGGRKPRAH
jgi:hypothetical protein